MSLDFGRITDALGRHKLVSVFVAMWILSMIALPIMRWTWGDGIIPLASTIGVVFQTAAVMVVLYRAWGLAGFLRALALVAVLTWAAEWLGSTTGFPFGVYHYTDRLQPQLLGVPLLIPFAWLMTLAPSWATAQAVFGEGDSPRHRLTFALFSAAAMTAWDLYLDPQMVGWGFWVWDVEGVYFGIPLSNFLGWFMVAALVTLIVRPARLPLAPLLIIYGVIWLFQAIGLGVFWGQAGPAIFGFVGMGAVLLLALRGVGRRVIWTF